MNYAAMSNVSPKIHVHCIPRYKEPRIFEGMTFVDTRWGKNYAPYDKLFIIDMKVLLALKHILQKNR